MASPPAHHPHMQSGSPQATDSPENRNPSYAQAAAYTDAAVNSISSVSTVSATANTNRQHSPPPSSGRPHAEPEDPSSTAPSQQTLDSSQQKKKRHRGGKKHKKRRQPSFAGPPPEIEVEGMEAGNGGARPSLLDVVPERVSHEARDSFYRLGRGQRGSATSLESEALLDHRDEGPLQTRRQSIAQGLMPGRGSQSQIRPHRPSVYSAGPHSRSRLNRILNASDSEGEAADDRTPLINSLHRHKGEMLPGLGYDGLLGSPSGDPRRDPFSTHRRSSRESSKSSRRRAGAYQRTRSEDKMDGYHVNNPPSVPGSPKFGPEMGYDDVMLTGVDMARGRSPDRHASQDALIDIDDNSPIDRAAGAVGVTPPSTADIRRRMTLNLPEDDVCFPHEADMLTEIGEEDKESYARRRRRRTRIWPELSILEEWATEEKEQRTIEGIRARKVSEPLMVGGRLRPSKQVWHRELDDQPLRFTYFNEDFQSTLHSQSISELLQEGLTFRDLFIPEPPVLSDSESDEEEDLPPQANSRWETGSTRDSMRKTTTLSPGPVGHQSRNLDRPNSRIETERKHTPPLSNNGTGENTPVQPETPAEKPKRYGTRPIWWLDVLCPTDAEMKVISKAFGIHPLTAEDVMMQEQREKVELFRNYYFVNYRTFEQDTASDDYMEPINMYVVVFREGVISFHFSQTPHPANVRRRIRQLKDYLILTTDWISYAVIDDITDAYAPLIQRIEEEVDDIDEAILTLHAAQETAQANRRDKSMSRQLEYNIEKQSDAGTVQPMEAGDMLRGVGECRKKVMSLYRLLGNKADVIKGFAKRCNEQWEIAPKSEIGLYLGDIQDHIVTMTGNLSHYENILSRAHSNYLAQINIRMNERAEKTNDVLGKLTVLGTIVLPMNIITGIWGMNCLVPGQDVDSLQWFWGITGGLVLFGVTCFFIAKRVYGIV